MYGISRRKSWILCCAMGALLLTAPHVEASGDDDHKKQSKKSKGRVRVEIKYDFEAGLIQCDDALPASLCGTDPLIGGKVEIKKNGSVEVQVAGAVPSTAYDVVYTSLDGSTTPIGSMTTDSSGNAKMKWWGVFSLGDTDAGNVMLERGGVTQFVSGFAVIQ